MSITFNIVVVDPKQVSCTNCQAVTTHTGRVVWVCEDCGEENLSAKQAPDPQTPDAVAAQAAISDAAAAAGISPVPALAPDKLPV